MLHFLHDPPITFIIYYTYYIIYYIYNITLKSDEGINTDHSPGIVHFHFFPLSFLDISVSSVSLRSNTPNTYVHLPGFLFSPLFRFLGTMDFPDFSNSTFCSQTRKHLSLIFSLMFVGSAATQLNLLTFEPPN